MLEIKEGKEKYRLKLSIIIFVLVGLLIVFVAIFLYHPNNNPIKMKKNDNLIAQYDNTRKEYQKFLTENGIKLYEYTDKKSLFDTLVYYYYVNNDVNNEVLKNIITESIYYLKSTEVTRDNIGEKINEIYVLSRLCENYGLNAVDEDINEIVRNLDRFLISLDKDLVTLNFRWKLKSIPYNIEELNENWNMFLDFSIEKTDNISTISKGCIVANLNEGTSDLKDEMQEIISLYTNGEIDIDVLIICLNMFPESMLENIPHNLIDQIFKYCYDNFSYLSPELTYSGFKISSKFSSDNYLPMIQNCYKKFPLDQNGYTVKLAQIVPTYRRLYQYVEVCDALSINIPESDVYKLAKDINNEKLMVEDYFYQSLLSQKYRKIQVEKNRLEAAKNSAIQAEITESNCYAYFYLTKALQLNGMDGSSLYPKIKDFIQNNSSKGDYLIMKMWGAELLLAFEQQSPNINELSKEILEYSGESKIEIFYQYVVLMVESGTKPSVEIKNEIKNIISEYSLQSGGFWRNKDYKYMDLSQTYQCLFLEYFLDK